ncbi:uncharacterized protein LOC133806380 [Humulus lupulus]|uniref:uncharacterized protein LOC133806380 n=1 Tax=Humulus lupulus TaxID=3486 RepID=UPI002B40C57F|nr:uncharacterized protein LOC133806380 [Humulus lupulus]
MALYEALYERNSRSLIHWHEAGERKFLRLDEAYQVAPLRWAMRFEKKGKLSPRFVGPFKIIERIGEVAYHLALLPALSKVHDVFHVSMLRKYVHNPSHVLSYEKLSIDPQFVNEEKAVMIVDRKEKVLRNMTMPLVKVHWCNHSIEEVTWEIEDKIRFLYPHLF